MRSKKRAEWGAQAESLVVEMILARNAVGQYAIAMMSGDEEGAFASHH
jgi:hypothetical protein